MFLRKDTKQISVGDKVLGGGAPIAVQSMTNTDTRDVAATVAQIHALTEAGCDIVRVAIPDMAAADAVADIRKQISIPLVTDIHFDYRLALRCMENGADKVRINPGNIGDRKRTEEVVRMAAERKIPIRIGVNGGSLEKELLHKYGGATAEAIAESAMRHVEILEDLDFTDIVVSLKSSDVEKTIAAYELMARKRPYPLHVGLTEAGTVWSGTIKSCA
ncbi:MAG: flavodoxin-dependent (E)-4-hydroxy-3-methylbut-2-enyl-diphosphate synthase, partial [Clostridia bacterium]|nr:flavodoxin-dependent (E)-4-hydroxy-3-methylbut-2-enyl-diphosphate synthase [Clostridia bacterium]